MIIRAKLFAFYVYMAFVSLLFPKEGMKMIDAANEGAAEKQRQEFIARFRRMGKTSKASRIETEGEGE